jgi:drug/metabolite transporter (DMT)-like permease
MSAPSDISPALSSPSDSAVSPTDVGLFVAVVLSWSMSWYALSLQADAAVAIQTSLMWRFVIACAIMFVWVAAVRERLSFPWRYHAAFGLLGVLIFCVNFMLFYYGSYYLISGLLSVVFSLASVFNLAIAFITSRRIPRGNVAFGALLGVVGIALMFAPEIAGQDWSGGALFGLGLCVAGTLSFCFGNQVSAKLQALKVPVLSASAWGMAYGAAGAGLMSVALGEDLSLVLEPVWLGSLLFLAVVSTVIAFWAYLTLLGRIGPARAGYATVVFPVLALLLSTVVEDYVFTLTALAGLVLVLAGNVLVLRGGRHRMSQLPRS